MTSSDVEKHWAAQVALSGHAMLFNTASSVHSLDIVNEIIDKLACDRTDDPLSNLDKPRLLHSLQNVVTNGAVLSQYLWPSDRSRQDHAMRLRKSLKVGNSNALNSDDLRAELQNVDKLLDDYLRQHSLAQVVPQYVGPSLERFPVPLHFLRAYFLNSGIFELRGRRFDVHEIGLEIRRLHKLLVRLQPSAGEPISG